MPRDLNSTAFINQVLNTVTNSYYDHQMSCETIKLA